jgi:hypothetical protein
MEKLAWYFTSIRSFADTTPFIRALLVCGVLYQADAVLLVVLWLLRKAGVLPTTIQLEPKNTKAAIVVLPTLLRKQAELDGLIAAMRSIATNGYRGPLFVVACIDGTQEAPHLHRALLHWAESEPVAPGVRLYVAGTQDRRGKAVAMDTGVEHIQSLVAKRNIDRFPELFFNMDADSVLGSGALERMVYRLTRCRWLGGHPHNIVTSNVIVPLEQCYDRWRSFFRPGHWIALSVAREYLGSITAGKGPFKLLPSAEVSGALYCTWSEIYLAAPYYARFMQTLKLSDWLRWWIGLPPPRFSHFRGKPLPEALTGPGDDTWMGWFASSASWKNGRPCFDFPRTPLHAFGRFVALYVSRPVAFDPLAKVFSKTPTTAKALFKQRLRWNSSRVQDLLRHGLSLMYHWAVGIPLLIDTTIVFATITIFAATPLAMLGGARAPAPSAAFAVLAFAGYYVSRLIATVVALVISDSPPSEWVKLFALPAAVPYHVFFNTITLLIGYYRDAFGFGEPTTFAPEATLLRSNLTRVAIAYRLRRALFLAVRSVRFGDVPFGSFWFGWKRTPFTPSGFEGWGTGKAPPPVFWPNRRPKHPAAAVDIVRDAGGLRP